MRRHRIPTQQVIEIDVLNLVDAGPPRHQFIDLGHRAHVHRQPHQGVDDFPAPLWRRGRNGEQDLGDVVFADETLDFLGARHLQAVDHRVLQTRIVVHKDHSPILVTMVQCREQLPARFTGAVDDDVAR